MKIERVIAGILIVLVALTVVGVVYQQKKYNVVTDLADVKEQAQQLHDDGSLDEAILLIGTYCDHVVTDIDAAALLGDWLMEAGREDDAISQYYKTAKNKKSVEAQIKPMTVKNMSYIVDVPITELSFEISPDVRMTKNMVLQIEGRNLFSGETERGGVDDTNEELINPERYISTVWFDVQEQGKALTLSGGFNCARWQFKNEYGEIFACSISKNNYRVSDNVGELNYQMARVAIPEGTVQCRVTYFDNEKISQTSSLEEPMSIVYGTLPGESREAVINRYEIPDLKEGEKIIYDNSTWTRVSGDESQVLDWPAPVCERGTGITMTGDLPGRIDFSASVLSDYKKSGIYTVRFEKNNSSPVGERLDDAVGLSFNPYAGNSRMGIGSSDFDNIYPWNEMKLCAISEEGIVYEGEYGYMTDGSSGNIFVEIPKFYSKRVRDGEYETISISGEMHEGFSVDEVFIKDDKEVDKIYVAAYMSSVDADGIAQSISGAVPKLMNTATEIASAAEKNGNGYGELDYKTLFAVQKLFMVESAMRNSQMLYFGVGDMTYPEKGKFQTATVSKKSTNTVTVSTAVKYSVNDNVILFSKDEMDSLKEAFNDVRQVTAVINNEDHTQTVYFSGEPMRVLSGKTAISQTAAINGSTNGLKGVTAAESSTARGDIGFKYRDIENIWGNAFVYVDGVTVNNGQVSLKKGNRTQTLSYAIPNYSVEDYQSIVKDMGYDENDPSVMLPNIIGDGASISTYYADVFRVGTDGAEKVLYYGGSWNTQGGGGLFCYSTEWGKDDTVIDSAGRMIYIP